MTRITGITLAVSTPENRVPGFAVEAAAHLFCMHDPAVRQWISVHRPAGYDSFILVTPDDWRNPGGVESLTFPIEDHDADELAAIWAGLMTSCSPAQPQAGS